MFKISSLAMTVNAIGLCSLLIVGTYAANSYLADEGTPPCSARYPAATELSLRNSENQPASPIELQARFGQDELGILTNVEIVKSNNAPAPELLQVKLFKPSSGSSASANGGLTNTAFQWLPSGMAEQESVCLSYHVLLPKTFQFAEGGVLPGLYGGERLDPVNGSPTKLGLASLISWSKEGNAGIKGHTAHDEPGRWFAENANFAVPRGRWTSLQQEIVLNAPGKADGILRLWIDGELRIERSNIAWRKEKHQFIEGVAADFAYFRTGEESLGNRTQAVRISPFSIRWRQAL
jgi:hypothetical protein